MYTIAYDTNRNLVNLSAMQKREWRSTIQRVK
jgi:hypothetical protein